MFIGAPGSVADVVWEGELVEAENARSFAKERPVVAIGRPEVFAVEAALKAETGREWVAPLGGARFWLVRLACTVRETRFSVITEVQQRLRLSPVAEGIAPETTYAVSVHPDRVNAEKTRTYGVKLAPKLAFEKTELEVGEAGVTIEQKIVFPVIESYDVGTPDPYWVFKRHAQLALTGTQLVYAVVAARAPAEAMRARVEIVASVDTDLGIIRLGLPREARAQVEFEVR